MIDASLFYVVYQVGASQARIFTRFRTVEFDFTEFEYYLICGFGNATASHSLSKHGAAR
jgi:hypothetical protein